MTTLDKTKPYGIIGGTFGIAKFEQGGKYFDNQGGLLDDEGMPLKGKAPKVGATKDNPEPSGAAASGQTPVEPPVTLPELATPTQPAPIVDEKPALVERAKALKIKSAHMMGIETLKEAIAKAEGALSPDAQLAANLGE